MNLQEFNNLKVGDKVVVHDNICADNLYAGHYEKALTYCSREGDVEVKYSYLSRSGKSETRVGIRFQDKSYFIFNIKDINIMQDMQTKTPHKHAAIIKAWADGEEIECKASHGGWIPIVSARTPAWVMDEYRIKPKFEKRYLYAYLSSHDGWTVSNEFYSEERWNKLWSHLESQKIEASGKDFQCN